jgi:hypothetical protein
MDMLTAVPNIRMGTGKQGSQSNTPVKINEFANLRMGEWIGL